MQKVLCWEQPCEFLGITVENGRVRCVKHIENDRERNDWIRAFVESFEERECHGTAQLRS